MGAGGPGAQEAEGLVGEPRQDGFMCPSGPGPRVPRRSALLCPRRPELPDAVLSVHPSDVLDMPVDPNEPTYCLCHQVSYGEMIGCDNPDVSGRRLRQEARHSSLSLWGPRRGGPGSPSLRLVRSALTVLSPPLAVSDRVVPLRLCGPDHEAQRKMVSRGRCPVSLRTAWERVAGPS